jgi:hypothetical protein
MAVRWTRVLYVAINAAIIIASAVVVIGTPLGLFSRWFPRTSDKTRTANSFRAGTKAPSVPGVDYARADRTLVIFLSAYCRYCQTSVPFYRELAARLDAGSQKAAARRKLVAVFPENVSEVDQFKAREKLQIDSVSNASFRELGVRGTPTAILVSNDGIIQRTWEGAPAKAAQEAILSAFAPG